MTSKIHSSKAPADTKQLERLAVVGEMFAEAAHEINNLMGTAASYAELEIYAAKSKAPSNLQKVLEHTKLAGEVALNVLHFASPCSADIGDVEHAIAAAVGLYAYRARKGLCFARGGAREIPATKIPTHHLQLALANVIRNAVDAVEQEIQPRIRITTTVKARSVVIEIWNSGPWIEQDILGRIFERFFTTKSSGTGTGLGLSVSRRLITDAGGHLTVANVSDGGVRFTISVPRAMDRRSRRPPMRQSTMAVSNWRRILVVDDEDPIREVLQLLIREMTRSEVDVCRSGKEALRQIAIVQYDAIVLDLRMPGLSGEETYNRLSEDVKRRVVFLTGDTIRDSRTNSLCLNGQPVLIKPVLAKVLFEAIADVAGRRSRKADRLHISEALHSS